MDSKELKNFCPKCGAGTDSVWPRKVVIECIASCHDRALLEDYERKLDNSECVCIVCGYGYGDERDFVKRMDQEVLKQMVVGHQEERKGRLSIRFDGVTPVFGARVALGTDSPPQ